MKVYLVMEGFEYEGESVLKVFADRAKAQALVEQCMAEDEHNYHVYSVYEFEVEE